MLQFPFSGPVLALSSVPSRECGVELLAVASGGGSARTGVGNAVALLALPGTLMGMPFPTSLSLGSAALEGSDREAWVARAWVLNGYASVVGSVGAMILAMAFGFSTVLALAAGCYVAVAASAWGYAKARTPER